MVYIAYLLLCMATPVGGEYCTPAVPRLTFETNALCQTFIEREKEHLRKEANLEEFREYLPTIQEGKLLMKSSCSNPIEREWLDREIPLIEPKA